MCPVATTPGAPVRPFSPITAPRPGSSKTVDRAAAPHYGRGEEATFPMTSKFHSRVTVGDSRADRPQTTYEALETEVGLAIYRVSPPGTRILAYFEARRSLDDDEGDEGE